MVLENLRQGSPCKNDTIPLVLMALLCLQTLHLLLSDLMPSSILPYLLYLCSYLLLLCLIP